jgi:hypothetical protein
LKEKRNLLGWIIEVWTAYAHRAAGYQTRVLLTLVYVLILGPAALLGRLFGARLLDLNGTSSTWTARPAPDKTLESLRRQF